MKDNPPCLESERELYHSHLNRYAQLGMGFRGFKALIVAVELDLFASLEKADGSLAALVERTGFKGHYLSALLDPLAALGFIEKKDGVYHNTAFSRDWLRPEGKRSLVNNIRYQEFLSQGYADLTQTIRDGRPKQNLGELLSKRPDFVRNYILGMAEIARQPAAELAETLDLAGVRRLLDVGGGHGIFTMALAAKNPKMEATILDLPETLERTAEFIRDCPDRDRIELRAGDYHSAEFGDGEYDLVLMSHVTHDEGPEENVRLFKKSHAALGNGGRLVIHDFVTDEESAGPLFSLLFGVQMLVYTEKGKCYSRADYRQWLRAAGFRVIEHFPVCQDAPSATAAIVATKGEGK